MLLAEDWNKQQATTQYSGNMLVPTIFSAMSKQRAQFGSSFANTFGHPVERDNSVTKEGSKHSGSSITDRSPPGMLAKRPLDVLADRRSPAMRSQLASMEGKGSVAKGLLDTNRSFIKEETDEPSDRGESKEVDNLVPVTAFSSVVQSGAKLGHLGSSPQGDKETDLNGSLN